MNIYQMLYVLAGVIVVLYIAGEIKLFLARRGQRALEKARVRNRAYAEAITFLCELDPPRDIVWIDEVIHKERRHDGNTLTITEDGARIVAL